MSALGPPLPLPPPLRWPTFFLPSQLPLHEAVVLILLNIGHHHVVVIGELLFRLFFFGFSSSHSGQAISNPMLLSRCTEKGPTKTIPNPDHQRLLPQPPHTCFAASSRAFSASADFSSSLRSRLARCVHVCARVCARACVYCVRIQNETQYSHTHCSIILSTAQAKERDRGKKAGGVMARISVLSSTRTLLKVPCTMRFPHKYLVTAIVSAPHKAHGTCKPTLAPAHAHPCNPCLISCATHVPAQPPGSTRHHV